MQQLKSKRFSHQADAERRIVLFGSYTRGEATEHSDVDLLVIPPKRSVALPAQPRLLFSPRRTRVKGSMSAETELVCMWLARLHYGRIQ